MAALLAEGTHDNLADWQLGSLILRTTQWLRDGSIDERKEKVTGIRCIVGIQFLLLVRVGPHQVPCVLWSGKTPMTRKAPVVSTKVGPPIVSGPVVLHVERVSGRPGVPKPLVPP